MQFVFHVKARGSRDPENPSRIRMPRPGQWTETIISASTIESAKKRARKQHDGTFQLYAVILPDGRRVKMSSLTREQKEQLGGVYPKEEVTNCASPEGCPIQRAVDDAPDFK